MATCISGQRSRAFRDNANVRFRPIADIRPDCEYTRMLRQWRYILLVASTLSLTSCTPPEIEIAVSQEGGAIIVTLTQDWGFIFHDRKPPCVDRIELQRSDGRAEIDWLLQAKTEACVVVERFRLGRAPPGFREVTPMNSNSHGRYEIVVWGVGMGGRQLVLP